MPEEISVQILSQASDNIQKLFDLSTRIDERVKAIQINQRDLEDKIETLIDSHHSAMQKIAVLESKDDESLDDKLSECEKEITSMDKRVTMLESTSGQTQDRWTKISAFIIQLAWVVLASYVLMKLKLTSPQVP